MRCIFRCGSHLSRMYIVIQLPGERSEPGKTGEEADGLLYSTLLAQAGLSPVYSYREGQNRLALHPPKPQRLNPLVQLALAIAGNVILDFFMTSCGISCLQSELLLATNRLGLLNKDKLKKEETI